MDKLIPNLATRKECTGCFACIDACNHEAIFYTLANDGHFYIKVNQKKCIGCKLCEQSCPIVSKIVYDKSECSFFYAAWARDVDLRKRSASGGAFSAIASYVLDKGGIVFGATIKDVCDVNHIYIEDKKDLYKLQGSKYTQSNIGHCYKKALLFLKQGRLVLFSGLGCQIGGLYTFLAKRKYKGSLITMDLICGGIPSKLLIKKFIENEPINIKHINSFRTKDSGWKSHGFLYNLKVEDEYGNIHSYENKRNLVTDGFSSELTNRYSCYKCKFVGTHRMSDFTIGDLWGDEQYPNEHYNGLSVLIAHNLIANSFLKKEELLNYLTLKEVDPREVISNNPRIVSGYSIKRMMPERRFLSFIFDNFSYRLIKKIYAFDFDNNSPWIIYKVYRYVINKFICK